MVLRRNVWECCSWMGAYSALIVIGFLACFFMQENSVSAGCNNTCINVGCIQDDASNFWNAPSGTCNLNLRCNSGTVGASCTGNGATKTFTPGAPAAACTAGAGGYGCAGNACNKISGQNKNITCCQSACQNPTS